MQFKRHIIYYFRYSQNDNLLHLSTQIRDLETTKDLFLNDKFSNCGKRVKKSFYFEDFFVGDKPLLNIDMIKTKIKSSVKSLKVDSFICPDCLDSLFMEVQKNEALQH
ncbi:hypothetical protein [Arcobacter sp. F2176]|jgi:hypothetical protein|uniref:hypothetical protein n=1 Tax=Arcobacter sp. F2176 TaxID=2044511 RepID=UPI00100AD290|nr:hypothetical protein [Arcobacter sp. F2176]RXJ82169.1 hypothetical protein CRU95_04590 [Arcobacter sp. F2176]